MENETQKPRDRASNPYLIPASILVSALVFSAAWVYAGRQQNNEPPPEKRARLVSAETIAPESGMILPLVWGDMGTKLVEAGAIDPSKMEQLYAERGGLPESARALMYGKGNGPIMIDLDNAGTLLNLLWALGLASENSILERGPMRDPRYGGADRFASTGGWPLAKGTAMSHYGKHQFFDLTEDEQAMVERMAKNIYRPCCDNSTHFPDCNHGMAMLGFLQLAASQGLEEGQIYKMALVLNSYWFPQQYRAIAAYYENEGVDWRSVDPKEALGQKISSASALQRIVSGLSPEEERGGGGSCSA